MRIKCARLGLAQIINLMKEIMDFEKLSKIKQIGKNREKLLALEKEGKFVFHGSSDVIEILEPRQAYNRNKETKQMEKDGVPAVFATPYADVAIFRALINAKNVVGKSMSRFGMDGEQLHFLATKNLLDQANKRTGKVYVLDKQKFKHFKGMQCRSEESIIPIEVVEVSADDLPQNIEIIEQGVLKK